MLKAQQLLLMAGLMGGMCCLAHATQSLPDVLRVAVPEDAGRITDYNLPIPGELPEFILIQDLHKHPEVQRHIAEIIRQAYSVWGVRIVFVEGAFNTIDLGSFKDMNATEREAVAQELIDQGNLTGAELAGVQLSEAFGERNASELQLLGMEDPKAYARSLALYKEVWQQREGALRDLARMRDINLLDDRPEAALLQNQLGRLEQLVRLRMTPEEYKNFQHYQRWMPPLETLRSAIATANDFYTMVNLRSRIFLREASRKLPAATSPRLLVVGGFHTPQMADDLRKSGHSYVVISPLVTERSLDTTVIYEKHLLETISTLPLPSTTAQ